MSFVERLRARLVRALGGAPPTWRRFADLDLAANLLATDHYLRFEPPALLSLDDVRRVVVVSPHPDDETIGAGGTLALLARAGAEITVVAVTDGGQRRDDMDVAESVRRRMAELGEVAAALGARVVEVGLSNVEPRPTPAHVERLAAAVSEARPDVVLAPWLLDRPVKHRLVVHLLALALRSRPVEADVWAYQVHNALPANGLVDITETAEEKRRLVGLFASQNSRYRRYDHVAMGLAAWNARLLPYARGDEGERYVEAFHTSPAATYVDDVLRTYLPDLPRVYGQDRLARAAADLQAACEERN